MDKERVVAGLIDERDLSCIREAVCISTEKIYDSCREKDCIENAKVLFRNPGRVQRLINAAFNVKAKDAEVVKVITDVEPVPFKRGFYTVNIRYFIKVKVEFVLPKQGPGHRIVRRPGLVVFEKTVILFGSEGSAKIFSSYFEEDDCELQVRSRVEQDNMPISKVEVAEPLVLNTKVVEVLEACCDGDCITIADIPDRVLESLRVDEDEEEEVPERCGNVGGEITCNVRKEVVATIGLFSIIKLARITQLLIPAFDFCVPNKTCIASTDENPCEIFDTIDFPVDEFFPPQLMDFPGAVEALEDLEDEDDKHKHHHHDHHKH